MLTTLAPALEAVAFNDSERVLLLLLLLALVISVPIAIFSGAMELEGHNDAMNDDPNPGSRQLRTPRRRPLNVRVDAATAATAATASTASTAATAAAAATATAIATEGESVEGHNDALDDDPNPGSRQLQSPRRRPLNVRVDAASAATAAAATATAIATEGESLKEMTETDEDAMDRALPLPDSVMEVCTTNM